MKKWISGVAIVILALFISAYAFFPKKVSLLKIEKFHCHIHSVDRFIMDQDEWIKWWPGKVEIDSVTNKHVFTYKGFKYTITGKQYNSLLIQMHAPELKVDERFFFFRRGEDTVRAEWSYSLATNSNPINRVYLYYQTKKISRDLMDIMKSMKSFLEDQKNVYGTYIHTETIKDTILVTTRYKGDQYPSTQEIYKLLHGIKNYITLHNAKQTGFPMLHVVHDSGFYKTQVAIPVNKVIPENKSYHIKRMPPLKILAGQVTGGAFKARDVLRQFGIYMADNQLSAPAIPFESLITNRMEEPDSSKWVTKIYYPFYYLVDANP